MVEAEHIDQPPRILAGIVGPGAVRDATDQRLARMGRLANRADLDLIVVEEDEISPGLPHRQMFGQMPVGAERFDRQLGNLVIDILDPLVARQAEEHVRAHVVRAQPVLVLVAGASTLQPADREEQRPGMRRLILRRGIDGEDRQAFGLSCPMRRDFQHPVRLELEIARAFGDHLILKFVRTQKHTVAGLLKEIDRRRAEERETLVRDRRRKAWIDVVENEHQLKDRRGDIIEILAEILQPEAKELLREREVVAHIIEPAEDPVVDGIKRLVLIEADLLQHLVDRQDLGAPLRVLALPAQRDLNGMAEDLLINRNRIRLRVAGMEAQIRDLETLGPCVRLVLGLLQRRLGLQRLGRPHTKAHAQARRGIRRDYQPQRFDWRNRAKVFGLGQTQRPDRNLGGQPVPASNRAVTLAIGRVEICTAFQDHPIAQRIIAKFRHRLGLKDRRDRRKEVRHQLLKQVIGEGRELVLELELHTGGQKRRAFQKRSDHRIGGVLGHGPQAFGNARILRRELFRMFIEQRKFAVVELHELAVHIAAVSILRTGPP